MPLFTISFVKMRSLSRALREHMVVAARAEIIECVQRDEAFTSEIFFCEQWFRLCRILREDHTPRIPLELISQVFSVERGRLAVPSAQIRTAVSETRISAVSKRAPLMCLIHELERPRDKVEQRNIPSRPPEEFH
jgi:hypothetical protein